MMVLVMTNNISIKFFNALLNIDKFKLFAKIKFCKSKILRFCHILIFFKIVWIFLTNYFILGDFVVVLKNRLQNNMHHLRYRFLL